MSWGQGGACVSAAVSAIRRRNSSASVAPSWWVRSSALGLLLIFSGTGSYGSCRCFGQRWRLSFHLASLTTKQLLSLALDRSCHSQAGHDHFGNGSASRRMSQFSLFVAGLPISLLVAHASLCLIERRFTRALKAWRPAQSTLYARAAANPEESLTTENTASLAV